jgi:hypothetical protein
MRTRRQYIAALVVIAAVAAVVVAVVLPRGLSEKAADGQQAAELSASTLQIDRQIAAGQYVERHKAAETARAARLYAAIPPTVSDRTILAGIVASNASSGTTLVSEQRAAASTSGPTTGSGHVGPAYTSTAGATGAAASAASPVDGVTGLPLTIVVNGPAEPSLVSFVVALQNQHRLMTANSLTLTLTNGSELEILGSAFQKPGDTFPSSSTGSS